jgi:SAM-dependent methyltransferase
MITSNTDSGHPWGEAFARIDESADAFFYAQPRLVEHIDDRAVATVERIYRERIPSGSDVLDLMSSWVSHLPADVAYASVTGLGMNAEELARNPRLDRFVVHDLNADPTLPFADASFDAVLVCVSIQYLTKPVEVLRDVARALRPGGLVAISFSNRCFPTKAVALWRATDDRAHVALVAGYLAEAGGFAPAEVLASGGGGDPLYAVVAARM